MLTPDKEDAILSFAAFFQIAVLMLQELLVASQLISHDSSRVISILLSAAPMSVAIIVIIRRRSLLFLSIYFISSSLILLTVILYPDNRQYALPGAFYLLCINIPCFLCLASIRNIAVLNKIMLFMSFVVFTLGLVYIGLAFIDTGALQGYSMTYSYYLLLPALVFANQRRLPYTAAFFLICALMFVLGSRGALLAAITFMLLMLLSDRTLSLHTVSTIAFLTLCAAILLGSFHSQLASFSEKLAFTPRTLSLLLEGEISQDSSRLDIYRTIWTSILDRPIEGYGIYGDRVILNGTYCHNIFLEILHNFGLLLGTGFVLYFLIALIRVFLS